MPRLCKTLVVYPSHILLSSADHGSCHTSAGREWCFSLAAKSIEFLDHHFLLMVCACVNMAVTVTDCDCDRMNDMTVIRLEELTMMLHSTRAPLLFTIL